MKRRRITVALCLVLCAVVALPVFAAGGKESTGAAASTGQGSAAVSATQPNWALDKSPVTLQWYVNEPWFESPEGNLTLEWIKEETGVNLEFIVPVGQAAQKFNTLIASNSLPDVVTCGWWEQQVPLLQDEGYVYALNDLADKYDPYFHTVASKEKLDWYRRDDGNVYAYPCASNSPAEVEEFKLVSNRSFLVRNDIYEAIGKPDMRTPEGFLAALKKAKEMFPTAPNGQPMIPIGLTWFGPIGNSSLEDILLEYLAIPREIDGKFYDTRCGNPHPDYIKWLKTFRKAHEMGLIAVDVFLDDRNKIEEKIQQGRYFALLYQWKDAMAPLGKLYQENPRQSYISIEGPANSRLEAPKLGVPGYSGWEVSMISKNTKVPDRAIRFFSFGISEVGQKLMFLGKEGVTYDIIGGKPVIRPEIHELKNTDMKEFKRKYNTYFEYWFFMTSISEVWEPASPMPFKQYRDFNMGKAWHYGLYDNNRPTAESDEGIILQKAENKWGEILPKLIMAKSDAEFDQIWNDYEAYKKQIGYERALEVQRRLVEANKRKVGAL